MLSKQKIFTLSNGLTLVRIALVPWIVWGIHLHLWRDVFVLLVIAGLTDMFDGFFARLLSEQTVLGAALDPVADKILLLSTFSALAFVDSPSFFIPSWFVGLVVVRETIILGGSLLLWILKIPFQIRPSLFGKLTTFFQITFILWLFVCHFFGWNPHKTYFVLLVLLALISMTSLGQYGMRGITYVRQKIWF